MTNDDAYGDVIWFRRHPGRRYRARIDGDRIWLVRRRTAGVLLRAWTASLPRQLEDTDAALRVEWFAAAWPELDPGELKELIKRARAAERKQ